MMDTLMDSITPTTSQEVGLSAATKDMMAEAYSGNEVIDKDNTSSPSVKSQKEPSVEEMKQDPKKHNKLVQRPNKKKR